LITPLSIQSAPASHFFVALKSIMIKFCFITNRVEQASSLQISTLGRFRHHKSDFENAV
jgi:hypothetical protein